MKSREMLRLFSSIFPQSAVNFSLSLSPPQLNLKSNPIRFKDTRQAAYQAQRLSRNSLTWSPIRRRRRVNFLVINNVNWIHSVIGTRQAQQYGVENIIGNVICDVPILISKDLLNSTINYNDVYFLANFYSEYFHNF